MSRPRSLRYAGPAISGTTANQLMIGSDDDHIRSSMSWSRMTSARPRPLTDHAVEHALNGSLSNLGERQLRRRNRHLQPPPASPLMSPPTLQGLVFTPHAGTPGQSVTTGFTISDIDTTSTLAATGSRRRSPRYAGPAISGTTANQLSRTRPDVLHPFVRYRGRG